MTVSTCKRWLGVAVLACCLAPAALADDVQPFQFSDAFYIEHGVDPTATLDHFVFPDAKFPECADGRLGPPCRTEAGVSPDPDVYNDVRVIETTGGFMHNGNLLYYQAVSFLMPGSFINNAAGAETRQICDDFRAFLFPKANGNPVSPAPPNRRQDNIFETNNGYFSNNPLGCWTLSFISWDGPNVNSSTCQDEMADLEQENGLDLDGTPVIRTLSDINNLLADGCVRETLRNKDGSQGFPWVI
ncbi:MAG: hypothetical protein D6696_03925 [Acidobacteria bacterium]|nr:MAG: hypothetical protein D6696_03925 [Acidobacteriota bacterium]